MLNSSKVTGIVLKRSSFGEADKIITLFTKEEGKIKVLAKGVRRIKSRRAPHLELFNQVSLVVHRGKGIRGVSQAQTINDFSFPKSNLKSTGFLFYLSEVMDKLLPENQVHTGIFEDLSIVLENPNERKVKDFVVRLLWSLGYLPRNQYPALGVTAFLEQIVEKPIRSKKFLEEI